MVGRHGPDPWRGRRRDHGLRLHLHLPLLLLRRRKRLDDRRAELHVAQVVEDRVGQRRVVSGADDLREIVHDVVQLDLGRLDHLIPSVLLLLLPNHMQLMLLLLVGLESLELLDLPVLFLDELLLLADELLLLPLLGLLTPPALLDHLLLLLDESRGRVLLLERRPLLRLLLRLLLLRLWLCLLRLWLTPRRSPGRLALYWRLLALRRWRRLDVRWRLVDVRWGRLRLLLGVVGGVGIDPGPRG
jgi:hypothetical protein